MGCIYSNNKGDNKSIQVANQTLISKDIKEPFQHFFDIDNKKYHLNPLDIQRDDLLLTDVNNKGKNPNLIDGKSRNLNQVESEGNNFIKSKFHI